ncbi:MAG TPA: LysM peptidoglycan-binding domain-containing protein, partial [Solirubrobacterales bacterium]|nr:LysM peptidoglycan-binding domain-containing protein [Solirubrobacterales bacterium]
THAERRQLGGDDPAGEPFNRLMEAVLAWGVFAERQQPIAAQGAVRTNGVATVTTTAPHGLAVGEEVIVAGVGDESFDGTFEVASVPSEDSFTYAQALPDAPASGGGAAAPTTVTADSLERLRKQLQDPQTVAAAFDYATLTAFLAKNFVFEVTPGGDGGGDGGGTGEALFPVIPALSLSDNQPQLPTEVDFGSFNPVSPDYAAEVRAYFQTLAVEFEAAKTADGGGGEAALGASSGPSMATVVFGQYFNMLMSAGVRAAIDALASYAYTTGSAMSIAEIAEKIPDESLRREPLRIVAPNQEREVLNEGCVLELPDVVHQAGAGDTFAKIAGALVASGARGADGQPYSAADLIAANPGAAVFVSGAAIEFGGLEWTTLAGETLELIAIRLLLRAAGPAYLTNVIGLGAAVEALQKLNPGIGANEPLKAGQVVAVAASATYTAVAGDTLTLIAAYALAAAQGLLGIAAYVAELIAANPNLGEKDPTKPQPAGEAVQMPPVTRTTVPGDSVETIAATLLTTVPKVEGVLLALPATTPLLAPQATLHAPLRYPIQSGDTFAKIAAKFDLTLADVAAQSLDAAVFAAAKEVVVADLETLSWSQLTQALLESGEWNNASAMVSRFMLSGLRLPDPQALPQAGADAAPPPPSSIPTKPLFALTGQQFAAPPAAGGYKLTLANAAGAPWLKLAGSASSFELGEEQGQYLAEVVSTPLEPGLLHAPTRL